MAHWLSTLLGADVMKLALLVCLAAILLAALPKLVELLRVYKIRQVVEVEVDCSKLEPRVNILEEELKEHKERMEVVRDKVITMGRTVDILEIDKVDLELWMRANSDKLNKILGALGLE